MSSPRTSPSRSLLGLAALVLAAFAGATWLASAHRPTARALPVLSQVPPFRLVEASGHEVSLADLRGAPWIADLVYTRCAGICPRISEEMARLQRETSDLPELHFVSFTVDPETDRPEVLRSYRERFTDDPTRWLFLTGDAAQIRRIAAEGFLLPFRRGDAAAGDLPLLHSSRLVLIDGRGRVRGTYDVKDAEAMLAIRSDLRRLGESGDGLSNPADPAASAG